MIFVYSISKYKKVILYWSKSFLKTIYYVNIYRALESSMFKMKKKYICTVQFIH